MAAFTGRRAPETAAKSDDAALAVVCCIRKEVASEEAGLKPRADMSAFDQGKKAGAEVGGAELLNPYPDGSADHRNFELGRRFGADNARERQNYRQARPDANRPDHDEGDD